MTGQEWLDLTCDYLLSKKADAYFLDEAGNRASDDAIRSKIEDEINGMTRCEYLITLGDSDDIKLFHDKQKLARGETLTKTYIVTMPAENSLESLKSEELQSTDA